MTDSEKKQLEHIREKIDKITMAGYNINMRM